MNNNVKSNFFFSYHINEKRWKNTQLTWKTKLLITILFLSIICVSMVMVGFQYSPYGIEIFIKNLKELFSFNSTIDLYPNNNLWNLSFEFLWKSIQGVIVGTTIGFVLAIISSYFVNYHFIRTKIANEIIKIILAILRALPTIVFIYFFKLNFGGRGSNVALYLLYAWFSWLWLHKYMIEIYDSLNYYPYYVLRNQGCNRIISYLKTIFFQINNRFISLYLYSLESNMRWVSLLGVLGFIGIGQLISYAQSQNFSNMGIPVFVITIFMLFLEATIFLINRFLLIHKSFTFNKNKKIKFYFNYKVFIKWFLLLLIIILFLVSIITMSINQYADLNNSFISGLFSPNWSILSSKNNLFLDILMLFFQSISIMFIAIFISLILIFISAFKLFKYYSIFGISITTIIRSFPMVALFFILNPLYSSPISSICVILAIGSATIISKNIGELINKIDNRIINYYVMQGYSKISIFFKYVLFYIHLEFWSIVLFEFESKFRDLITYGSYGASSIGASIDNYQSKGNYINMAPFIWISFFITLFIIIINYLIKFFLIEKRTININYFIKILLWRK